MGMKVADDTEPIDPNCVPCWVVEGLHIKRRAGGALEYQIWETRDSERVIVGRFVWLFPELAKIANDQIRQFIEMGVMLN